MLLENKMKLIYLILLALAGCGHTTKETSIIESSIPKPVQVVINRNLLSSCKPIPELKGNTELDLITWISEWKLVYLECKLGKDALVTTITTAFPQTLSK